MGKNIEVREINGFDVVRFQPTGVCCKLMELKIQDNIIKDVEFVGGCSGNLGGISVLIKGMNINEIFTKLEGLPCGNRGTSCPDQLSKCIKAYLEIKEGAKV